MTFEFRDAAGEYIAIALPEETSSPTGRPSLELALREYFAAKGMPQPQIRNGVGQGMIHAGSSLELLQLGFSRETFYAATHWIRRQKVEQLRHAKRFCAYTERHVFVKGFLVIAASRVAPANELIHFARRDWQTDISPLFALPPQVEISSKTAKTVELDYPQVFRPARIAPLPPRPLPQFVTS